jgi:hypothetical protein
MLLTSGTAKQPVDVRPTGKRQRMFEFVKGGERKTGASDLAKAVGRRRERRGTKPI